MGSAYRPRHKTKNKNNLTQYWGTNPTTNKHKNVQSIPTQLKNIITPPPITPPITKSTPNKYHKSNKNKPKIPSSCIQIKHTFTIPTNKLYHTFKSHLKYKLQRTYLKPNPSLTPKKSNNIIHNPNSTKYSKLIPHPRHLLLPRHGSHPKYIHYPQYISHPKHNPQYKLGTYPNLINYPLPNQLRNIISHTQQHTHPKQKTSRPHPLSYPYIRYSPHLKHNPHPRIKLPPPKDKLHPKIKLYPNHKHLQPHSKYISHPKHRPQPRHNSHQKNKLHPKNKATSTYQPRLSTNIKTHLKNKCSKK